MRRPGLFSGLAIAVALSGAAHAATQQLTADGFVKLTYGQRAVLHIDDSGALVIDGVGAGGNDAVVADHIVVTLSSGSTGTMMVVANGYATPLNYHARMIRGADVKPTSVCTLIPKGSNFENWPYKFDAILVGGFTKTDLAHAVCQ